MPPPLIGSLWIAHASRDGFMIAGMPFSPLPRQPIQAAFDFHPAVKAKRKISFQPPDAGHGRQLSVPTGHGVNSGKTAQSPRSSDMLFEKFNKFSGRSSPGICDFRALAGESSGKPFFGRKKPARKPPV